MADKYRNFDALRRVERMGGDFRICLQHRSVPVAIIAPHGGKIEPGTSEIAAAIAGNAYSLYCFEGMRRRDNGDLHITSTNFDEPKCVDLIRACDIVVAVHGRKDKDDNRTIYLGGLDKDLGRAICDNLEQLGFAIKPDPDPNRQGVKSTNICNRGRRGRGVQFEMPIGLRTMLLKGNPTKCAETLLNFATAIRCAIEASVR